MNNQRTDRPERRTALIARELSRYNVDVAALSETRLADQGQLTEIGGGYVLDAPTVQTLASHRLRPHLQEA